MNAKVRNLSAWLLLVVALGTLSCKRDRSELPDVLVDIQVNINNPGYINLQAIGGSMYFDGGSRGIIVYRKSADEFIALERHCPYQASKGCRVTTDDSGLIAVDSDCCGSRFLLTDGSVQSGSSSFPLRRYQTYFDGAAILRVYN